MAFGDGAQIMANAANSYAVKERLMRALLFCIIVLTVGKFLWKVGLKVSHAELHSCVHQGDLQPILPPAVKGSRPATSTAS